MSVMSPPMDEEKTDMTTPVTPYEMLGGSEAVDAIVTRFYALMDNEPDYSDLRALHADDLGEVRAGLVQFLNAWLGGPRDWFGRGKCVMSLHRGLPVTPAIADQWADAMARAITAQPRIDRDLGMAMAERLGQMARAMVNRVAQEADAA